MKLGIVGFGNFGRLHAETAARLAEFELVALVDSREECFSEVGDDVANVPGWSDLETAVEASGADAWIVATSTSSHVSLTKTLLEAGKPVLLEKPIAGDLMAAELLRPVVAAASGSLMLGHVVLFNSEFRQLRDEAARRGSVDYIDCVRHRPASTVEAFPGENPFHLTMVHDLYAVFALKQGEEPVEITAQSGETASGECDLALAQLRWKDGSVARFTASFKTPPGMPGDGFDRMEVFGSGWAARISPNPRPVELWDEAARWPATLEIGTGTGMLAEQLRCFSRVVRGEEDIPLGARYEDGIRIQGWLEKMIDQVDAASQDRPA